MTEAIIHFELATPERRVLKEEVRSVTVPTTMGEITVLPHHIPLVAQLQPGVLTLVMTDDTIEYTAVSGGFIEVLPDKVVVLADTAERSAEIDEARAAEAYQRAQQLMSEKQADAEEYAAILGHIEKELARVKVARKKKYRDLPQARS